MTIQANCNLMSPHMAEYQFFLKPTVSRSFKVRYYLDFSDLIMRTMGRQ